MFCLSLLWKAYLWLFQRTGRITLSDAAEASLQQTWDLGIPTLFLYWHDEALLTCALRGVDRLRWPLRALPGGFAGRVGEACWRGTGAPTLRVPDRLSRPARMATLEQALRTHKRLLIAADDGGPRFTVQPTAGEVARGAGACWVALHVGGRGVLRVFGRAFPLPFAKLQLSMSEPQLITASPGQTREAIRAALDGLRYPGRFFEPSDVVLEPLFPGVEVPIPPVIHAPAPVFAHGRL